MMMIGLKVSCQHQERKLRTPLTHLYKLRGLNYYSQVQEHK
uniref:Uncharacterized protein n=1 Tax=Arundo donax TaxID=35708 RepID=A0A0A9BRF8_ARUDO